MKVERVIGLMGAGLGLLFLLPGCWDLSSSTWETGSTTPGVSTQALAGYVEDPGIQGARVELWDRNGAMRECGTSGRDLCRTVSEHDGYFRFYTSRESRSGLRVVAAGGRDVETGTSFGDLELQAFAEGTFSRNSLAVTPVTTLVVRMYDTGKNVQEAEEAVRIFLGLDTAADLSLRPMGPGGGQLLQRSMVITKIITDLVSAGEENPFAKLVHLMASGQKLIHQGNMDETTLQNTGLSPDSIREVRALHAAVRSADGQSPEDIVAEAKKSLLADSLLKSMERLFADADGDFEAHRDFYRQNAAVLSENLLHHREMPVRGLPVERIFRYLIDAYDLVDMELNQEGTAYVVTGKLVSVLLQPQDLIKDGVALSADPRIRELSGAAYIYDVAEALLPGELPGNDNAKRIHYYYHSNVSRLYKAETMLDTVLDDTVNDTIRAEIVRGKAKVGFFDEAKSIIREQMYLDSQKASAWVAVAENYVPFAMFSEAKDCLDEAFRIQKSLLAAKGYHNLTSADTGLLQTIAKWYRKAQHPDEAGEVARYMHEELGPHLPAGSYARILQAMRDLADDFLSMDEPDQRDAAAARSALDGLYRYAQDCPPTELANGRKHYMLKVMYLADAALRYAWLGDGPRAFAVVQEVEAIRANDGLLSFSPPNQQYGNFTGELTWVYVPTMVEALSLSGYRDESENLLKTLPPARATQKARAYGDFAAGLARHGAMAQDIIDELEGLVDGRNASETAEMHIRALTYFNEAVPHAGMVMIEEGRYQEAALLADQALKYINAIHKPGAAPKDISLSKVFQGYLRCARIYNRAGYDSDATKAMELAETVLFGGGFSAEKIDTQGRLVRDASGNYDREWVEYGRMQDNEQLLFGIGYIALMWKEIGDATRSRDFLERGRNHLRDISQTAGNVFVAKEYNKLIRRALDSDDREMALFLIHEGEVVAEMIHTAGIPENQREKALQDESQQLRGLGEQAWDAAALSLADRLFRKAYAAAEMLASLKNKSTEMGNIAQSAGDAGLVDFAMETALAIPLISDRYGIIGKVSERVAKYDAFKGISIAWVDTDRDGRPDFFHPLATQEMIDASGLVLDDDCNGNGIPDTEDPRPLYMP
ncbi:hypothetical protein OOT00_07310 [Desulfobotulus sp. H1]|uniref:Tetratricopeptide repeat protein n=1 Tax=Desulfobotulus pelophilus TaxID=2823377 RepID=A0ABT3N8K2_9BACT|nr:hypothetical protein [Desulfobotulus pelophilus]MCW7753788.1 hypothetical protein [Desulfobotulus pelophilus]